MDAFENLCRFCNNAFTRPCRKKREADDCGIPIAGEVLTVGAWLVLPRRMRKRLELDEDTGCWIWKGSNSGKGKGGGYGRVSFLGCTWATHLLVFYLLTGKKVPANKQLDHTCERRLCCNPDHMDIVSNKTNTTRAHKRRRMRIRHERRKQQQRPIGAGGADPEGEACACGEL